MSDLISSINGTINLELVRKRQSLIFNELLYQSDCIKTPNFDSIQVADLQLLFELYDKHCFNGQCEQLLKSNTIPIRMRLSSRMTSAGGKTTMYYPNGAKSNQGKSFDIAISTVLLFESFGSTRNSDVVGLKCQNRLEGLQRIFEHELVHLIEMLVWCESSCARRRFRAIANQQFGHLESHHQLITPSESASRRFNIRTGDKVRFEVEGQTKTGFVNRITRRATVLVHDRRGQLYDDGQKYVRFYVPIRLLKRA